MAVEAPQLQTGQQLTTKRRGSPQASRFGNLQKYITANEPQAQQMGQGFVQAGQKAGEQFQQQVSSQIGTKEGQAGKLTSEAQSLREGIQAGKTAGTGVAAGTSQNVTQDVETASKLAQGGIGQQAQDLGTSFQTAVTNLETQAQQLAGKAREAGTEEGRFGLLRERYSRPGIGYTTGQQRLDQLLLQSTPGVGRQIAQAYGKSAQEAGTGLIGAAETFKELYGGLSDEALKEQEALRTLLTKGSNVEGLEEVGQGVRGTEDIEASIRANAAKMEETLGQDYAKLAKALSEGSLTQNQADLLKSLGIDVGSFSPLDVDASKYLSRASVTPELIQATNPEELARLQALQRIIGQKEGFLSSAAAEDITPVKLANLDMSGLKSAVDTRRGEVLGAIDQATANIRKTVDSAIGKVQAGGGVMLVHPFTAANFYADGSTSDTPKDKAIVAKGTKLINNLDNNPPTNTADLNLAVSSINNLINELKSPEAGRGASGAFNAIAYLTNLKNNLVKNTAPLISQLQSNQDILKRRYGIQNPNAQLTTQPIGPVGPITNL